MKIKSRTRSVLWRLLLPLLLGGLDAWANEEPTPPNIIVIIADDMGWADIGYNNSSVYTPNLDSLAASGVIFEQHYVMPQCTPTRVALFTGKYPSRFGPQAQVATSRQSFPHGTLTLSSMLKEQGYRTFMSGKWHMGSAPEWGPQYHGFDSSHGSLSGAVGMYDHRYRPGREFEHTWHREHELIPGAENGQHVTDITANEAIRFIQSEHTAPFFLYLPFHAPHTPLDERGDYTEIPTQLDPERPERWLNEDRIRWFHDPKGLIQAESDPERRLYLAVVYHLDFAIGRIVESLEEAGLRENTLIIFASDNGPQVNWKGDLYPNDLKLTDFNPDSPLRGSKLSVYEGGIRVPAFAVWPNSLEPTRISDPIHIVDWLPTVASIVDYQPQIEPEWDGIDLSHALADEIVVRERPLYWLWGWRSDRWALRHGEWKIVSKGDEPATSDDWELYNIASDPYENVELSEQFPEQRTRLHQLFLKEREGDLKQVLVSSRLITPDTVSGSFQIAVEFSEAISSLEKEDFEIQGGEALKLMGRETSYTLHLKFLKHSNQVKIHLPANAAYTNDGRGNSQSRHVTIHKL